MLMVNKEICNSARQSNHLSMFWGGY